MLVPLDFAIAVCDLDEAYTAFEESSSHQALSTEVFGDGVIDTVLSKGCFGFALQVLDFWDTRLHSECEFKSAEASGKIVFAGVLFCEIVVEFAEQIELLSLLYSIECWRGDMLNGCFYYTLTGVSYGCALAISREECGTPIVDTTVGEGWADGDEGREVLVFRTESVGNPSSHAWAHELIATGVDFKQCATVCGIASVEAPKDTEFVDVFGDVGKEFADGESGLTTLGELPWGLEQVPLLGEYDARQFEGRWFTIVASKGGFRIEGIDMRRPSFHEQEDDSFGAGREVGVFWREWIGRLVRGVLCSEECIECESTESECGGLQDASSRE